MKSFTEFLNEARTMPPALKKKIDDINSGSMDNSLNDEFKKAKKSDNKQIMKAITKRKDAIIDARSNLKYLDWAKSFIKQAQSTPEFSDPEDIANSAGLNYSDYEMFSKEINKHIKKITGKRNIYDFVKSIG